MVCLIVVLIFTIFSMILYALIIALFNVDFFDSFCISDALASIYNIELTNKHLPERQDDTSCLVIPPSVYSSQYSSTKPQTQPPKNAIVGGRGMDVDVRRKDVKGIDNQPTRVSLLLVLK